MNVCSLEFILGLTVATAVFSFLSRARSRHIFFFALNIGFLYTWLPDLTSWIIILAFSISGYLAAVSLRHRYRRPFFVLYLTVLLASFVFLKKYDFLKLLLPETLLDHPFTLIGLSYILFRQIHFLVDAVQGEIPSFSLFAYFNYQFNLFTLLSGPIQRFKDFERDWNLLKPVFKDRHELLKAYLRILLGIVKMAVIAAYCLDIYNGARGRMFSSFGPKDIPAYLEVFYAYPAYVYFNFAGYCDIVIGGASLFGLKLPENFDHPYVARNMIDFWSRWHVTLSFWLRDYIYTPIYKTLAQKKRQVPYSLAFGCYFVTFFLAGVWHGSTWNFAIFGLLHGIGVTGVKIWERIIIKNYGREGLRKYMQSFGIRLAGIFVTFNFVCFTFLFFPEPMARKVIHFIVKVIS